MQLTPHPSTPLPPGWRLATHCSAAGSALELHWLLHAPTAALRVPPRREPSRRDGLWRHTCFELFVADPAGAGYREFNFSPSTEWAAYAFTGYRQGMAPLVLPVPPVIGLQIGADMLQLSVAVPQAAYGLLPGEPGARRRCAFAAVLEQIDGTLSYLALAHPAGRPDFHDAAGFVEMPLP
ncbi:MAG: DOMON-like domain-containing protein [Steroidobacteraceae bacterium]